MVEGIHHLAEPRLGERQGEHIGELILQSVELLQLGTDDRILDQRPIDGALGGFFIGLLESLLAVALAVGGQPVIVGKTLECGESFS